MALGRLSIGLLIIMASSKNGLSFEVTENVIFPIQAKWMFTFVTDLKPYENFVWGLRNEIFSIERIIQRIINHYSSNINLTYAHHAVIFHAQSQQLSAIQNLLQPVIMGLLDLQSLKSNNRSKRAVIPIVGKALHFLFGTLTSNDLKVIASNLEILMNNQDKTIHSVKESLSILNITRIEVRENREAITDINKVVNKLIKNVDQLSNTMVNQLKSIHTFIQTYIQFNIMITDLQNAIDRAMLSMQAMGERLNQLALGHLSPSVVSSHELTVLLRKVASNLPRHLFLPKEPEMTRYYYQTLTCTTLIEDNKFLTLINVPLLEVTNKYEIFMAHNIPLPYNNTGMVASYVLETKYIAMDTEKTEYMLLNENEAMRCGGVTAELCTLTNPSYSISQHPLCVISLYAGDTENIQNLCDIQIETRALLPLAYYLSEGHWVIVSLNGIWPN